jgi:hypothetical protein
MDDKSLLELCVKITGSFENGAPDYDAVTGNFDGMGLSVGVLQWCAGQGSLQTLLQRIGAKMGWDRAQSFFRSDIHHFAVLKPKEAIQWCLDRYIAEGSKEVDPGAKHCWQAFLGQPESITAQVELATSTVLHRAKIISQQYCPDYADHTRAIAFFFDLVTQSGGMENSKGRVDPVPDLTAIDPSDAITVANQKNPRVARMWSEVVKDDVIAQVLLHYAHARSLLSNPLYMWDALSRRGAIACREGVVHGKLIDLVGIVD